MASARQTPYGGGVCEIPSDRLFCDDVSARVAALAIRLAVGLAKAEAKRLCGLTPSHAFTSLPPSLSELWRTERKRGYTLDKPADGGLARPLARCDLRPRWAEAGFALCRRAIAGRIAAFP